MSKVFMPDSTPEIRKQLLEQNADSVEETTYLRSLTADELDIKRETITENCIKLSELEDEKKDSMAYFKKRMDPLAKENKAMLTEVKTKQTKVSGKLYHMANHDDGMMETYDGSGEMISSRRLKPDEKQGRIFLQRAM